MKKYEKLEKKFDYDKEQATELAEAYTELVEVERRAKYLQDLIKQHSKLKKFMWGSQDGKVTALHDLEDDHLKNILQFLPRNGREISAQMKAEARSRGFDIPDDNGLSPMRAIAEHSEFATDEDLYDGEDRWGE